MIINDITLSAIRSGKGECIHIRFNGHNLIIDSGPTSSAGEFRKLCESILACGEQLDALVITHYDDDHIGGILKIGDLGFQNIYFNAYDGAAENGNLSATQNQRLFHILPNAVVHTHVVAGDILKIGDAKLTIHAPTQEFLSKAYERMMVADAPLRSATDWDASLDELMERPYPCPDASISNMASIVFTFEYENNRILFTGDAWPASIPAGKFELVKLPHHGSIRNVSDDLISGLDTDSFLICADGMAHPNKQTVAKLLRIKDRIIVYSNYAWWMNGFLRPGDMSYIDDGKLEFRLL